MPEKKILRLTCPVCESRLRVAEGIERFACLTCGAELLLERDGDLLKLVPTQASAARMSDSQQQLIEVNTALKSADDVYGVGCAIATMGITLVACIILALAIVVQSQVLFWAAIAVALVLLGFVLFMFLTASSRGTDPLLQKRDQLQAEVENEQGGDEPEFLEESDEQEILEESEEVAVEAESDPAVEPQVEPEPEAVKETVFAPNPGVETVEEASLSPAPIVEPEKTGESVEEATHEVIKPAEPGPRKIEPLG